MIKSHTCLLLALSSISICTAKTTMPTLERMHRHLDTKTQASDGTIDFKDAITVTSGKGFVRAKDGTTLSAATIPQTPPLFWSSQEELAHKLKQLAATSRNDAITELRNALITHYLDDPTPLLAFVRDLDSEGHWLEAHARQNENAPLFETWQALVITVNNLLLW